MAVQDGEAASSIVEPRRSTAFTASVASVPDAVLTKRTAPAVAREPRSPPGVQLTEDRPTGLTEVQSESAHRDGSERSAGACKSADAVAQGQPGAECNDRPLGPDDLCCSRPTAACWVKMLIP